MFALRVLPLPRGGAAGARVQGRPLFPDWSAVACVAVATGWVAVKQKKVAAIVACVCGAYLCVYGADMFARASGAHGLGELGVPIATSVLACAAVAVRMAARKRLWTRCVGRRTAPAGA